MPRKAEEVIDALEGALAAALPVQVQRNEDLPQHIPSGGLLILRDGDPGEPTVTMSPLTYTYEHAAELDVLVSGSTSEERDPALDNLLTPIGVALQANRTLGGLCDWVEPQAPAPIDIPVEGAASIKAATVLIVLTYDTTDPLL